MDVSIIIPYYNAGAYLQDALQSVAASVNTGGYSYEVIIINDGSTDKPSIDLLGQLDQQYYIILHQENQGPAAARNAGAKMAKGNNLLFLDSDNKIRKNFIDKALQMLNLGNADIVYGKPAFFGATTEQRFKTGEFNIESMLVVNHIDICSMIRKKVWEDLGGFDEDRRLIAFEDWDFWIRAGAAGYNFCFIDEVMFDYRITNNSLLDNKNKPENHQRVVDLLYEKHKELIFKSYRKVAPAYIVYNRDEKLPFRTFLKHVYYKYIRGIIDIHATFKKS